MRSQTIFTELESALKCTYLSKERVEFLNVVREYIVGGAWSSKVGYSDRVLTILRLGYADAAKDLSCSEESLRQVIKRASDALKDILGSNIIRNVVDGTDTELSDTMLQFELASEKVLPESYILSNVVELIPKDGVCSYLFEDLTREVDFLRRYSKKEMLRDYCELDDSKLSYILKVLSSSSQEFTALRCVIFKNIVVD